MWKDGEKKGQGGEREWELQRQSEIERETLRLKKKSEFRNDPSLLCSPDVRLCAGLPVQAFGTGLAW